MADGNPGLVKGVTTTSGTGTYVIGISSGTPYQSLAQAVAKGSLTSGDKVQYVARDTTVKNDASYESGEGTFTVAAGPTYQVSRDTVYDGSNGPGVPVSWGASGQRDFYLQAIHPSVTARTDRGNIFSVDQKVHTAGNPGVQISEGGSATSYTRLQDTSANVGELIKNVGSGLARIRLQPQPADGTSEAAIGLFRSTNTSGARSFNVYKGDGSSTITFMVNASVGNIDTEGNLDVAGGVVLNSSGGDNDTRIAGDSDANLLYIDAGGDRVGVGLNAPTVKLDVVGSVKCSGGLTVGTTANVTTQVNTSSVTCNTLTTTGGAANSTFLGYQEGSADPTSTNFPNNNDWGFWRNTLSADLFLVYNDLGVVKKVLLS